MEKNITVTVKQVDGGSFDVTISEHASLKSFREIVAEKLSIDESAFKLVYIGKLLKDDDKSLEELEIKDGVSVFVLKSQTHVQEIQPTNATEESSQQTDDDNSDDDIPRLPVILDVRVGSQNGNEPVNIASAVSEVIQPLLQRLGTGEGSRQNGENSSQRIDLASSIANAVSSFASRLSENLPQADQRNDRTQQPPRNSSQRHSFVPQRITIRARGQQQQQQQQQQQENALASQLNTPSNPLSVGIAVPLTEACDAICKEGHVISERASSASLLKRVIDETDGRHTENPLLRFISQSSDRGDRLNNEAFGSLVSLVKIIKERDLQRSTQRNGTGRFSEVERMSRDENGNVSISYIAPAFRSFANSLLSVALLSHSIAGLAENQAELSLNERIVGTASLRSLYRSLTFLSHASAALNHVVAKVDFGTNPSDSLEENDLHLFEFANSNNRVRANGGEARDGSVTNSSVEQHDERSHDHSVVSAGESNSDDILNSALLEMDDESNEVKSNEQPCEEKEKEDKDEHNSENKKDECNENDEAALLDALNDENDVDDSEVEKEKVSPEKDKNEQTEKEVMDSSNMEEEEEENEDDILANALMDSLNEPQPSAPNDDKNKEETDSLATFMKRYEGVIKQDEEKLKTASYGPLSDVYKFGTFDRDEEGKQK